jgi:hypothetical protein
MPESLQTWLKYYYLRLKAASGHQQSLDNLLETATRETDSLEVTQNPKNRPSIS